MSGALWKNVWLSGAQASFDPVLFAEIHTKAEPAKQCQAKHEAIFSRTFSEYMGFCKNSQTSSLHKFITCRRDEKFVKDKNTFGLTEAFVEDVKVFACVSTFFKMSGIATIWLMLRGSLHLNNLSSFPAFKLLQALMIMSAAERNFLTYK